MRVAELKEYEVEIGGLTHTVLLDGEDAKRLGVKAVEVKQSEPKNKSRQPVDKAGAASAKK